MAATVKEVTTQFSAILRNHEPEERREFQKGEYLVLLIRDVEAERTVFGLASDIPANPRVPPTRLDREYIVPTDTFERSTRTLKTIEKD